MLVFLFKVGSDSEEDIPFEFTEDAADVGEIDLEDL
jgi:hypothetical protein